MSYFIGRLVKKVGNDSAPNRKTLWSALYRHLSAPCDLIRRPIPDNLRFREPLLIPES